MKKEKEIAITIGKVALYNAPIKIAKLSDI